MSDQTTARRAGGRAARKAMRAAPLAEDIRPLRPGLEGGTYSPLAPEAVDRIHEAALTALEEIGLADAPPSGIAALTGAGAILGEDGRIRFPRALVEDMVARAPKQVTLHGRDPRHDLDLSGTRTHYGTAGAAVMSVDPVERTYRASTVQDLFDAARITQVLDNVHFFQRPMVCCDIADNLEMDLNTVYACCAGTTKHVGTSVTDPSHMPEIMEMLHMMAGGEAQWRARPFVSNSNCFVVPPMKFATESCQTMEACIRARHARPAALRRAGRRDGSRAAGRGGGAGGGRMPGRRGLCQRHLSRPPGSLRHLAIRLRPAHRRDVRRIRRAGTFIRRLRPDAPVLRPSGGAAAGIADAKLPDMQAGWEQAISNVMVGLAGLNMVYESIGMHASLLGFCLESLILGDDLLGQVQRCVKGVEVTEDAVSLDTMRAVCLGGPGHYLGSDQTLKLMQTEYVYPALANRMSPKEWLEQDRPDLIANARARKIEILARPTTAAFCPDLDRQLRQRFAIHLA